MNIEFINGEMIVTHESGFVSRYKKTDLEEQKSRITARQVELDNSVVELDSNIAQINASLGA